MNTLESRIYSEAVSAAAEVTPADIPALRLDRAPGRSRPLRRALAAGAAPAAVRRPGAAHRWLAPAGAVAGVAAVVAATLIVGHFGAVSRGGASSVSRPAAGARGTGPVVSKAQAALAAEALDYYFPASGAQYTQGWAFQWALLKAESSTYDGCMQRASFPVSPFAEPEHTFIEQFPDNSQFPDLAQRAQAGSMSGPQAASPDALPPPASPAGSGAAQRCRAAAQRPFAGFNAIASPLQPQWSDIVTAVQASAPVTAMQPSFSACLVARGVPASLADRTDPGADNGLFYGFFSWADTLLQEPTSSSQSVADEHRAAQVFVACAGPTVAVMERLQQAQRTTFLAQHAGPVSQIEALAETIPGPGR